MKVALLACVSTLRLLAAYFVKNMQAAMEYRGAFLAQIVILLTIHGSWLLFWWTYFLQFPLVNGWQQTDIIVIWAISALAIGLGSVCFGNVFKLPQLISTGGLDVYLAMPRPALLHICISESDSSGWGDIVFALVAFNVFVHPALVQALLFVLLGGMASLIFVSFLVIVGSLTFFLGRADALMQQVIGALTAFSTYPMNIFHGIVRVLLFSVIPAGFISYVPLQLLHQFTWPVMGVMSGFTILLVLCALGFFHLGLKRYESGNLFGMQN